MNTLLLLGLDVSGWATGGFTVVIAGAIVTILRKKGFNLKKWLGFGASITKELGEAFLATSDVLQTANDAIKNDNRLIENSVKDVVAAGKEARLEWKDVVMVIKPKKSLNK